ncbi:hypothetical protein Q5752_002830 [Cryptotrichosporon argae]
MAYPPTPTRTTHAEEYELGIAGEASGSSATPGAATTPRRAAVRTMTLHPNQSTLLFSAPGGTLPSPRRARRHRSDSGQHSPTTATTRLPAAQFLREDLEHLGPDTEEVHVPDFGHLLGFSEGEDHYAIAQGMKTRWKRKLYLLMEEPSSGREAFFIHMVVTGAIVFSAILTTLSTLPSFHVDPSSIRALFGLDTTLVVLFTVEYLARTVAHSDSWAHYYNWATSFFALLDLVAILPYYIEVAKAEDTSTLFRFSILRTFRLLRVFRAFKYQNQMLLTIEVMYVAVRRSRDALVAISFFILLVLVLFSTLIYFAERGTWDATVAAFVDGDGDVSQFDSIPQTAWFALVTMSTVGYGDVVPKSALGKLLTVPLLMFGLLLIALPSFVLGRNFAIVFDAMSSLVNQKLHSTPASPDASPILAPVHLPPPDATSAPLLPTTAPAPKARAPSPILSVPMAETASGSAIGRSTPRMWEGEEGRDARGRERDLTNIKLAKNQLVLLEQIDLLKQALERQGEMLETLMAAVGQCAKDEGASHRKAKDDDAEEDSGPRGTTF